MPNLTVDEITLKVKNRVADTSGAVIELTLDTAGRIVNSRVISQATGRPQQ